jgi:hypothetical protein
MATPYRSTGGLSPNQDSELTVRPAAARSHVGVVLRSP